MIKNPSLKGYFSRFRYKKGEIALKFLINDDEGMDKFVEDVAKKFSNAWINILWKKINGPKIITLLN